MSRQQFSQGTWLDPEEMCYPSGSIAAGRKAKALCADGRVRTCQVGIPDTFFSIPARTRISGKSVSGFVHIEESVLHFTANRKHRETACQPSS